MEIKRSELEHIQHTLSRGKSVLLFGPRQVGKTTLVKSLSHQWRLDFSDPRLRQQYERDPGQLIGQVRQIPKEEDRLPVVIIDEVQKVPEIMDALQVIVDEKWAQLIITASSPRKLKNLLPGRVIRHRLGPCTFQEFSQKSLEALLINGSLPGILSLDQQGDIDAELSSYATVYLEEEIRKEGIVRRLSAFSQFLQLACSRSGEIINLTKLSQEIGVAHTTIAQYYDILEECMLVERFEPVGASSPRKRLTKSPRYCVFDLGVRRWGALEGDRLPQSYMAALFEQWVGLELRRTADRMTHVQFWRDHAGPEVDWVLVKSGVYLPVEVKWTTAPTLYDARHLHTFLEQYNGKKGVVVARIDKPQRLSEKVIALPWQQLNTLHEMLEKNGN